MGYVIGCDIGSQTAKAVLLSPDGVVIGTASSSYAIYNPQSGWAEQDPVALIEGMADAVTRVLAAAAISGDDVTHLGLASQVDGVVATDAHGLPLRNALIWMDRRAHRQSLDLAARVSPDRAFVISGLNIDASHPALKIMWIRDEEPDIYRDAAQLGSVASFAALWLSSNSVHDHANASSTLLYDLGTRDYSDELVEAAGIDRSKLPAIGIAHAPAGTLSQDAAARLGLSTRCVLVTGTGDEHAAFIGAGGLDSRHIVDVVGTAEVVGVGSGSAVFDPARLVETHAHAVDGSFLIENPGFVSGGSVLWLATSVLGVSQREVFDLAALSEPGARGVRFLPALMGAMTPRWNDGMRGAFYGLSTSHDRTDLARAVLEGACFAFRDIADRLGELGLGSGADQSVLVVGGGARSELWLQVKATISGRSLRRVLGADATATGAAILAAVAAGTFPDVPAAVSRVVAVDETTVDPETSLGGLYEHAYQDYRALYDTLESTFAPLPDTQYRSHPGGRA